MSVKTNSTITSCGGKLLKLSHDSTTVGCEMRFNLYLPPQATSDKGSKKVPVLMYLSGLTCTPDNCTEKGFFQYAASKHCIALLWPDTSPRGIGNPGEDDSWDFGSGAGFYVDATNSPWDKNYKMYSYVVDELPKVVADNFDQVDMGRLSLCGHSMGGHGALTIFLKNPGKYQSVSAFAPITNPLKCAWGEKAFKGYFGEQDWEAKGAEYDASELLKGWKGKDLDVLIDQGTEDNFYKQGQLLPENFVKAAQSAGLERGVNVRFQPGYDHSYFFMSSFSDEHVAHAAKYLSP